MRTTQHENLFKTPDNVISNDTSNDTTQQTIVANEFLESKQSKEQGLNKKYDASAAEVSMLDEVTHTYKKEDELKEGDERRRKQENGKEKDKNLKEELKQIDEL